jgi:hypothetical protein
MRRLDITHIVAVCLAVGLLFACCGCKSIFDKRDELTPAKTIMRKVTTTRYPDRRVVEEVQEVQSTGTGFKGASAKDLKVNDIILDFEKVEGGGIHFKGFKLNITDLSPLYYIGGGAILIGAVVGYLSGSIGLGIVIALAGGCIIGVGVLLEQYPWVVLIAAFMVFVAIGYAGYQFFKGKRYKQSLEAIVPAVEEINALEPEKAEELKKRIDRKASSKRRAIKDTVTGIKRKLNLD